MKKTISVVIPTFNEENNIKNLYEAIQKESAKLNHNYTFNLIFIDNCSTDNSVKILKELALKDKLIKIIVNNRNYGHIRSPYYGILQSFGDATIYMACDFQDPPELIRQLIQQWENGSEVIFCQKKKSQRKFFYRKATKYLLSIFKKNFRYRYCSRCYWFWIV